MNLFLLPWIPSADQRGYDSVLVRSITRTGVFLRRLRSACFVRVFPLIDTFKLWGRL